ncbi:hypothetical protein FHG87_013069 [Trinorchestia longiramus]|nr:hypothetical protein FHG87_013069 [Trinorchestia longiramus]
MTAFLESIKYAEHKCKICGDLKVIALLLGMQLEHTKDCCFLCLWGSRNRKAHYIQADRLARNLDSSERNVVDTPVVDTQRWRVESHVKSTRLSSSLHHQKLARQPRDTSLNLPEVMYETRASINTINVSLNLYYRATSVRLSVCHTFLIDSFDSNKDIA